MEGGSTGVIDFGRFLTGFLVVMGIGKCCDITSLRLRIDVENAVSTRRATSQDGFADSSRIALPALLAHCYLITYSAMAMSIIGGLLIYGTIISFTMFFQEEQDF